jgi:5-methyltetrahydropteroyltriglutamate--homocysteine methyltransferase
MMIATNNGSYPWKAPGQGESPDGEALDRLTREAIDEQVRAGLDLVTDGLIRRQDPVSHLAGHLAGVALGETRRGFPGSGGAYRVPIVASEIAWEAPILTEDFLFAREGSPKTVKQVLVGPYTLCRVAEDRAYNDPMAMAMAFAIALNAELKGLQAAGLAWAQIDEPALLHNKEDFPTFTRLWEVLGRGVTMRLSLHLEGGDLGGLYPGVTRLKRLSCLSLDCVRGRASLGLLKETPLPADLMLGLGLVDGGSESVENSEAIVSVLRSTPGLPAPERILLGTASDLGGLPADVAFAKLQSLARARDLV